MNEVDLKELFNQLRGEWVLERDIQTPQGNAIFKGRCVFTEMDDGRLLCNEIGTLNLNGNESEANRSYIYAYQDNRIVIFYNDPHRQGDVLHELLFQSQGDGYVATHCHLCGQDTYDLTFTMLADSRIQMDYVVKGPQKDYAMQSFLTRHVVL